MLPKITTIINYCTNDYKFLKECIDGVVPISREVIVPYCVKFFDGTDENRELLEKSVKENPDASFIKFEFDSTRNSRWHHNVARQIGMMCSDSGSDYFLFLDVDEIVEPVKFALWWKLQESKGFKDSYKIANYWYFRERNIRAKHLEDSITLVRRGPITENLDNVFHNEERMGMYMTVADANKERMCTLHGTPFVHHYSWVRTKEEMLKKVKTWGHSRDKNWVDLVNKEFEESFRGKDVIFCDREYDIL